MVYGRTYSTKELNNKQNKIYKNTFCVQNVEFKWKTNIIRQTKTTDTESKEEACFNVLVIPK